MTTNNLNKSPTYIDNAVINNYNSIRLSTGGIMNYDINELQELKEAGFADVTIDDLATCYEFLAATFQILAWYSRSVERILVINWTEEKCLN